MFGNQNKNQQAQNQQAQEEERANVFKYRATVDCTFGGKYRRKGEIIHSGKKLEAPHFELVEG